MNDDINEFNLCKIWCMFGGCGGEAPRRLSCIQSLLKTLLF